MKNKRLKDMPSKKTKPVSNIKIVQENSVLPSKDLKDEIDLPLKRFKGTKWNGNEVNRTETKEKIQNKHMKRKGVVDFTDESDSSKIQSHESYGFMSKLEQFSDVWNDYPAVKNPKENFESWNSKNANPQMGNKMEEIDNKIYSKTKSKNEFDRASNNGMFSRNVSKNKDKSLRQLENETNKHKSQEENLKESKECNYPLNSQQDTKNHDSNISDLKRKKAVQEHSQIHDNQKNIIKQALSSMVSSAINNFEV